MNTFLDCLEWLFVGPQIYQFTVPAVTPSGKPIEAQARYVSSFGKTKKQILVTPELTGNMDIIPYWSNEWGIESLMETFQDSHEPIGG